jgi:EpsI family protein
VIGRAVVLVTLIAATGLYTRGAAGSEITVARDSLFTLPVQIGGWVGRDAPPFADDVLATLGVDEYINRRYVAQGAPPIDVYVGYYRSQRRGDTIHSPRNCLPGAGWEPVSDDRVRVDAGTASLTVNRYVIQKGLDRQVVFYWYQGRGRVIAGEYTNKLMLMLDAARLHRTDGGIVRLMVPVRTTTGAASHELSAFAAALGPSLSSRLS